MEGTSSNVSYGLEYGDAGQRAKVFKGNRSNLSAGIWDGHASQRVATFKALLPVAVTESGMVMLINEL